VIVMRDLAGGDSVFECLLRPEELKRLRGRLKPLLVPEEDDVR
jgi:CRISPR/Cas system-associated endoribonuclease Cas2